MLARRNLLLKCSICVNVVVLLYICSHVMIGNNTTNNLGNAAFLLQPIPNQQSTQKSSLSKAQIYQDEKELEVIFHNKELKLQEQLKLTQEALQVCK